MKKVLALVMVMVMAISLCACGSDGPATIVDNDGNTVQMTAEELKAEYDENTAWFKELYYGGDIELTGTVESVSTNTVKLKEGWEIELSPRKHGDFLTSLNKGDKVYVKSNIYSAFVNAELKGMTDKIGYNDNSLKTTVIRKAEDQQKYKSEYDAAYNALSENEKTFFDSYADVLKRYVQKEGIGAFTRINAWYHDKYAYFYLENKGPASIWMRVEDGHTGYVSAPSAKALNISKNAKPILDGYDNVQEVINLYIDL